MRKRFAFWLKLKLGITKYPLWFPRYHLSYEEKSTCPKPPAFEPSMWFHFGTQSPPHIDGQQHLQEHPNLSTQKKKSECLPIIHNQLHSVPWNLVPAFLPKRTNSRSNRAPPPQEVHGSTSARGAKVSCLERCRTSDVCRTNSLLQLCLNYTQNRIRLWILKTSRMNPHYFRNPHTNISSKTSSH